MIKTSKSKFLLMPLFVAVALVVAGCGSTDNQNQQENVNQEQSQETVSMMSLSESFPEAEIVSLDLGNSVLGWSASRVVGNSHTGEVRFKSGEAAVSEEGEVLGADFVIDMTTISESNNSPVVNHIKSDDFFSVETYPEAKIMVKEVVLGEDGGYFVRGDLTIKDITNEIVFPATIVQENGVWDAQANFAIDRTLWDIRYDSIKFFSDLADKAIKDEIIFNLNIKTILAQ